jgi:hypothetical protein
MPFWWFYPDRLRSSILSRWRERRPAWTEMVATTDVVTLPELRGLFPDAQLWVERSLGLPKSYTCYRPARVPRGGRSA